MDLPVDVFLSSIEDRKIYYFSTTKINSSEPHYFICLKRTCEDTLFMSCCTSQFDTPKRFVESRRLPYETLVYIKPDEDNPFNKETYVNCNKCEVFQLNEFQQLYKSGKIEPKGYLPKSVYVQILVGFHESPLIDENIKELLPDPDSI